MVHNFVRVHFTTRRVPLDRLVDQDPLQHGSSHSQWSCQELATVLARQTGVQLSRESVRDVLKKRRQLQSPYGATCSRPR
jgi:hypothetical protein